MNTLEIVLTIGGLLIAGGSFGSVLRPSSINQRIGVFKIVTNV